MINAGIYIGSTPLLDDTVFEKVVIFITEYNEKGAMGFVTNKLFPRKFNELQEFSNSRPFPLYEGGPVDQEHLYFVHRRPELITGGVLITANIYLGGDFKAAVKHINNGTLSEQDIRLFIGYCGWDFAELDTEIAEGSWQVMEEARLF